MANNSKKSSTSKTARVMNLLSKNREDTPEVESAVVEEQTAPVAQETAAPAPAPAAAPAAAHPATPPIISSMQADSAISDRVLSALETALEDELGAAAEEAPAPAPAVEEPAPQVEEVVESEPAPAPVAETEPVPAPAPTEEESSTAAQALANAVETENQVAYPHSVDKETIYVNVMEALVEDKANKYIDLFGLCKCPRCMADVKAMTLNHLEPKYVVMKKGDVIPRITLYEGQFAAAVTAQLLKACRLVMEHPRHDRT